jgi:uncharacterized membrane protein YccF (DUF307 family)
MRTAASLVHLASGGLVLSVLWLAAAAFCVVLPPTRPLARSCLQLAAFNLYPFGRDLVHDADLQNFRLFLRTGRVLRGSGKPTFSPATIATAIFWSPAALVLIAAHALHGIMVSVLTLSNPWRTQSFSALRPALLPLGWQVVRRSSARARLTHSRRAVPLRYVGRRAGPRFQDRPRLVRSASVTAGSAVLALWASYSATGPLTLTATPPGGYRGPADYIATAARHPMPSGLYRVRPEASPPVPLGWQPLAESPSGCPVKTTGEKEIRLARRHTEFAIPLGAAQLSGRSGFSRPGAALARISKAHLLAASRASAKIQRPSCARSAAQAGLRAASLAAGMAEAERLARKAAPDTILASLGPSPMVAEPRKRHRIDMRDLENINRMAALVSPAKSPRPLRPGDLAARVAKAQELRAEPAYDGESSALGT